MISIYKKGDKRECTNYPGISLLNIPRIVYAKGFEKRCTEIFEPKVEGTRCGLVRCSTDQTLHFFHSASTFVKPWEYTKHTHVLSTSSQCRATSPPNRKVIDSCVGSAMRPEESGEASPVGNIHGKRPRGRPRTQWRDYVSGLAWSRLGMDPAKLSEFAVHHDALQVLLGLLPPSPEAMMHEVNERTLRDVAGYYERCNFLTQFYKANKK